MSQSHSPTRAPVFSNATARFAATVDFPTPPLPLAIAMMCRIPSIRVAPAPGPCRRRLDIDQHLGLPDSADSLKDSFCIRLDLLRDGRFVGSEDELDGDGSIIDLDPFDQAERNDIAAKAGILHTSQCFLNLFLRNGHGGVSYEGWNASKPSMLSYFRYLFLSRFPLPVRSGEGDRNPTGGNRGNGGLAVETTQPTLS